MAGRTSTKKKTSDEKEFSSEEIAEIESSKKDVVVNEELESMKKLMETMMSELKSLKEENEKLKNEKSEFNLNMDEISIEYVEIPPNQPIKVISLFDGGLTLKVNHDGSGKTFRFDKFGHSRAISYSDIQDIIAVNRKLIEEGYVYICDKNVIRNNYLEEYYDKFLTSTQIDKILNFTNEEIKSMVSGTTRPIQETIITLIVDKINKNEYVNRDKVDIVGKNCNPQCDIFSLALQKRVV